MTFPKKGWLATLLMVPVLFTYAQQHVKGKVVDAASLQPIAYATVTCSTGKTTLTDQSGRFQINITADTVTLQVSCIGYIKQLLKAGSLSSPVKLIRGEVSLNEVQISPQLNNGSFHTLSVLDLNLRPVNSSQDLMRLVPGLFIAQHMGGGKAEQIFIRGFDADHGTDLNISADGMPVNMVSHIHGQGYADLHFLIPETIASFDYGKGPYDADKGDFATAGYLNYTTKDAVNNSVLSAESGQFHTFRAMGLINLLGAGARQNGENAYIAGEYNYTNGAFKLPEHYKRTNLFAKYTRQIGDNSKLSLSASAFSTSWIPSGEIPERAVATGTTAIDDNGSPVKIALALNPVNRFGTIDSAQNGRSTRINVLGKLNINLKNNWAMHNQVYYTHYTFNLHVNSTFYADDPINGDEKEQHEARDMFGYDGKLLKKNYWSNAILSSAIGIGTRFDRTYGTYYTHVTQQYQYLNTITAGDVRQNNTSLYLNETLESGKWLINGGARVDYFNFGFHDSIKTNVVVSPKISIQYTPNNLLQFYIKGGKGFHSNNAIAVIGNNGLQTLPAAYGIDLGFNWKPFPRLYINAALWYLYLQQEFVYTDDGDIAAGGSTTRSGIDLSARYQLASWLFADLNVNLAHPRYADSAKAAAYLPLAPILTSTGGFDFRFSNGINGGLSYRYMHNRPGNNTNTLIADGYFVTDLKINYTKKRYELGLTVENLLNTKWNEFEAERVSQLKGETSSVDQMSFTPGTPFFTKLRVAWFF